MKKFNLNNLDQDVYYFTLANGFKVYLVPFSNKKNFYAVKRLLELCHCGSGAGTPGSGLAGKNSGAFFPGGGAFRSGAYPSAGGRAVV